MTISKVKCVQEIYQAFGRGDVASIVAHCTPDTRWGFAVQQSAPWHRPVTSAQELPKFFGTIAESVTFEKFEPREFVHSGPHVMVDVRIEYTVNSTGRRVAMDQIHWWTFDEDRVARMVHYEDSAQVAAAVAA